MVKKILGIDPGLKNVGVGIISYKKDKYSLIHYSYLTTKNTSSIQERLEEIAVFIERIVSDFEPEEAALERIFFNRSKSAIEVAEAIGAIMLALHRAGIPVFQYTPNDVKMAVTGYGAAEKKQVERMVSEILGLKDKTMLNPFSGRVVNIPNHIYDALAVALLHLQVSLFSSRVAKEERKRCGIA